MKSGRISQAFALLAIVTAALALGSGRARADIGTDAQERIARFKQVQHEALLREPFSERRELAERMRELKRMKTKHATSRLARGERLLPNAEGAARGETRAARMARIARAATPGSVAALSTNKRVNDPSTDLALDDAQSEVSIAADGQNIVVAWNDGDGLDFSPFHDAQGYGWSTDGGTTWTDGGTPPAPQVGKIWFSDPVLSVNTKTHQFYFSALFLDPNDLLNGVNGVGVVKGSFSGGSFSWGTPVAAVSGFANTDVYDKEWMAADSISGNVYVAYVHFFVGGDQIEFIPSTDGGTSFLGTRVLSSTQDKGYVQAPRVLVGPTGQVYVAWYAIGNSTLSAWGRDYYRFKTSTSAGSTFGSQVTAESLFVDFGNGAPGFNRGNSFAFPGAAVDNTTGPHRGRVYLSWNESCDFYNTADDIGYRIPTIVESPGDFGNASGSAKQITVGDRIHATIASNDQDWFKFTGTKDSTIIVFCDSVKASLQPNLELRSSDGVQELAFASGGLNQSILNVFTLPQTGTYYLRVSGATGTAGAYSIFTGYHRPQPAPQADRGRDHRDVFAKYTDVPTSAWGNTAVRVNSEPADFDDWLPEIAVGGNGKPYVAWLDFHDYSIGFPGTGSTTYLSRSDDGGTTWAGGSPISDVTTYWWNVASNIAPNQGDYIALHGTPTGVLAGWGDGRDGDPNVYFSRIDLAFTAVAVSLASAVATPDHVSLAWQVADANGFQATLERRTDTSDWAALATLTADGTGRMAYDDAGVTAGRWGYRLRWSEDGVTKTSSEAWVDVPATAFALRLAETNPTNGSLRIAFTLPSTEAASLELVDVTGRELARVDAGALGAGTHTLDLAAGRRLPAGVYLVRLQQGARHVTLRATVIR